MNRESEILELNKIITEANKKLSVIRQDIQQDEEKIRKEHFDNNIKNRIFFKESVDSLELIKTVSCSNFGMYNSCIAKRITVFTDGESYHPYDEIRYNDKDTCRVDMLSTHYKEANIEDINRIKNKLYYILNNYLKNFIV